MLKIRIDTTRTLRVRHGWEMQDILNYLNLQVMNTISQRYKGTVFKTLKMMKDNTPAKVFL